MSDMQQQAQSPTLKELLFLYSDLLLKQHGENVQSLLLYGSYAYRDLDMPTAEFQELTGKNGLLDKKPDFIMIVSDLETSLAKIGEEFKWDKKALRKLLDMDTATPFYFNLKSEKEVRIPLNGKHEMTRLPYKIGVIEEDGFSQAMDMENYNVYLACRLSKFFNVLYNSSDSVRENLDYAVTNAREHFSDMAISSMPEFFTGRQFVERYMLLSYLFEAYRIFDIVKKKHTDILGSSVFDLEQGTLRPMQDVVADMLETPLFEKADLVKRGRSLYDSEFVKKVPGIELSYADILRYNLASAKNSFYKNAKTNSAAGGGNLSYVLRKFRK